MRKLADFQIDSERLNSLEEEVTEARGDKPTLRDRIAEIGADFRVESAQPVGNDLSIMVHPGRAYINDSVVEAAYPQLYLLQGANVQTDYYLYLKSDGSIVSSTQPSTDADLLPLAVVSVGESLGAVTVTDVRPLLQRGGAAKEVQEARGGYVSLDARLDAIEENFGDYGFRETHVSTEGQQVFTLEHTYPAGGGRLCVYVDGLLMDPGPDDDYLETDKNTVTFNYPLTAGRNVQFLLNSPSPETGFTEVHTAQAGQQAFGLQHPYPAGRGRLQVYVNGLLNSVGADADYLETNPYTVTFNAPFGGGERIVFYLDNPSADMLRAQGGYPSLGQRLDSQLGDCNVDIAIEYDDQNRPAREVWTGEVSKVKEYTYYANGLLATERVTEGNLVITTTYTYNEAGLTTGITVRKTLIP